MPNLLIRTLLESFETGLSHRTHCDSFESEHLYEYMKIYLQNVYARVRLRLLKVSYGTKNLKVHVCGAGVVQMTVNNSNNVNIKRLT